MTRLELARCIDHTALKPETSAAQIDQLCDEALQFGFAAVCVNPVWVERCVARLARPGGMPAALSRHGAPHAADAPGMPAQSSRHATPVVCTVAGFPLGASLSESKALEARLAVEAGAREVDMVVNLAALIAGDRDAVRRDIEAVVAAAKGAGAAGRADAGLAGAAAKHADACVKVIVESAALTDAQIILACRCVAEAQADYIKTSTGFHPAGGAKVEHVALMHKHIAPIKIKAAGGIRDLATAKAMLAAGAARLGMSASVAVVGELTRVIRGVYDMDTIDFDLPCASCGYNLRGLSAAQLKCPECGLVLRLRERLLETQREGLIAELRDAALRNPTPAPFD